MSFAKRVKEELNQVVTSKEESMAELTAMIELATEFTISEGKPILWFKSSNPGVVRRFLSLLKSLYKIGPTLLNKKQGNFKKGSQILLGVTDSINDILAEHSIFGDDNDSEVLLLSDEAKQAYLRGAFLTSGSVNDPKTSEYHLEIYADSKESILKIQRLMNYFEMNAKVSNRRKGLICYLKDANKIEDLLRFIGASDTVFEFEDLRIRRDFNNSINRILNCEIANEKKTFVAAQQQLEDIELIEKHNIKLNEKLTKVISLRKNNPDVSLLELVDLYEQVYQETITKSGLNHRLNKIKEIASDLKG